MSMQIELERVARAIPTLRGATLVSTNDDAPCASWGRDSSWDEDESIVDFGRLVEAHNSSWRSLGSDGHPHDVVMHVPEGLMVICRLSDEVAIGMLFNEDVAASWAYTTADKAIDDLAQSLKKVTRPRG